MTGALLFLLLQSWQNKALQRLQRLRQPKYFVAAMAGGLYFAAVFSPQYLFGSHGSHHPELSSGMVAAQVHSRLWGSVGAVLLFGFALAGWVLPNKRAALIFSEAEVAFLFPAPIARRTLVHFKLVKSQLAILAAATIIMLISGMARGISLNWTQAIGWWVILSAISLHGLAASFTRTLLLDRGVSNAMRRFVVLTALAVLAAVTALWVWRTVPPPPDLEQMPDLSALQYYLGQVLQSGPLPYLLFPFRLIVQPSLASNAQDFLRALGPALVVLALLYVWIIRSDVAFEEASLEASQRRAEALAAARAGKRSASSRSTARRKALFELRPTGLPSLAFLWKNLIGAGAGGSRRALIILAACAIGMGIPVASLPDHAGLLIVMTLVTVLPMSFLFGPQMLRQDFRMDLPMADLIKTYPLPAWQVALGELLAPVAILTVLQWFAIGLIVAFAPPFGGMARTLEFRVAAGLGAAVLAPTLNLVGQLISNALVLLFPGWFSTGTAQPRGIEATGQRMISMLAQIVVLAVALVPPAGVFAISCLLLAWLGAGSWMIIPAAVAASAVLAVEGAFGVVLLGKLFERLDVSSEAISAE